MLCSRSLVATVATALCVSGAVAASSTGAAGSPTTAASVVKPGAEVSVSVPTPALAGSLLEAQIERPSGRRTLPRKHKSSLVTFIDPKPALASRGRVTALPSSARSARAASTRGAPAPRFPIAQTFELQSLPGSSKTIYLDFDGVRLSGTTWNETYGQDPLVATAYDRDGNPNSFTDAELAEVQHAWETVAADFAPFDVNVTTKKPAEAALTATSATDDTWGLINVVTSDDGGAITNVCGCGGYAVGLGEPLPSNRPNDFNDHLLSWTFPGYLPGRLAGDIASHELGHQLGLSHDGEPGSEYSNGSSLWSPALGALGASALVQWSRGEYTGSNNTQDDLATIAKSLDYRRDTVGDSATEAMRLEFSASPLPANIEQSGDVDAFTFTATSDFDLVVEPTGSSTNLDLEATLLDAATGQVVSIIDKPTARIGFARAGNLDASAAVNLPDGTNRTYTLLVTGSGFGEPGMPSYYPAYGSLGEYTIAVRPGSGESTPPPDQPLTISDPGWDFQVGTAAWPEETLRGVGGADGHQFDFIIHSNEVQTPTDNNGSEARLVIWPHESGPTVAGSGSVEAYLSDSHGTVTQRTVGYTVNPDPADSNPTTLEDAGLGRLAVGAPLANRTVATRFGGVGPFTWESNELPAGISLNTTAGTISGTPTRSGTGVAWIAVRDRSGTGAFVEIPWTVEADPANDGYLEIVSGGDPTTSPMVTTVGSRVATDFTTSGADGVVFSATGRDSYRWTISGGPAGLRFIASNTGTPTGEPGLLRGAATTVGEFSALVSVSSGSGANLREGSRRVTIKVLPRAMTFATAAKLPTAKRKIPYSTNIRVVGGLGDVTVTHSGGQLPPGLSLRRAAGGARIVGSAKKAGLFTFKVTAADELGRTITRLFKLRVW